MTSAFICQGVRTPIGRYAGALSSVRTDDLAAWPLAALHKKFPQADWELIDDVILGCANQAGEDNRNVARMALLLAGLPPSVPGFTVNRLCASGLEAIAGASRSISRTPSSPVAAWRTSYPSYSRIIRKVSRMLASSSITRIRGFNGSPCGRCEWRAGRGRGRRERRRGRRQAVPEPAAGRQRPNAPGVG